MLLRLHNKENEELNLIKLANHINNKTNIGAQIISKFKDFTNYSISSLKLDNAGSRNDHFDCIINTDTDKSFKIEHKQSIKYKKINSLKDVGVQILNGGLHTETIKGKYQNMFYDKYIGSGVFKNKFNLESHIPSSTEWTNAVNKWDGDKKCPFINELKLLSKSEPNVKSALNKFKSDLSSSISFSSDDLELLKNDINRKFKEIYAEKDYFLLISGDLDNKYDLKWFRHPTHTMVKFIEQVKISKTGKQLKDITFNFVCSDDDGNNETHYKSILRWRNGCCITNINLDIRPI